MAYKIRNDKLYHAMRLLIQREISFLEPFLHGEMFDEFLQKTEKEYPYMAKFIVDRLPTFFNDYYILLVTGEHKEEMQQLPEYIDYKKLMLDDEIISRHFKEKIGNLRGILTLYDWDFFYFILNRMLNLYFSTKKFDNALFDDLYCDLESFLYNEYIPLIIIAPLHNFKLHSGEWNFDCISLADGLLIRRITQEERQKFFKYRALNQLTFREIGMFQYVIQYTTSVYKFLKIEQGYESKQSSSIDDMQKVLDDVITALRLQHNGVVGYSYIQCKDILKIPVQVGGSLSRGPFKSYGSDNFILDQADGVNTRHLYHELKSIGSKNLAFILALKRFNSAYSDISLEDKIIDFAISYELLFSREGDGTDSISHKIALRFSRLVTEDNNQIMAHYKKMKRLYKTRSAILHGNIESNRQKTESVVIEFEENMRSGLKSYLERFKTGNYQSHTDIIQELDLG
jgi:hypothetical protein